MAGSTVAPGLAVASIVFAAIAAAVGLLIPGLYRDAPVWAVQARGADLATLALAVPLAGAGVLMRRSRPIAGQLIIGGVLLYLTYTYALFAFSVAFNPLTIAYIGILGGVVWALTLGAPSVLVAFDMALPQRRATGWFLISVAILFALLWLGQIIAAIATGRPPVDIVDAGIPTNPVYALDLAFFLPLAAIAGVGVLRDHRLAGPLALPVLVWVALISAQIVGGFLFLAMSGAVVPVPVAVVITVLGVLAAAFTLRPAVRADSGQRHAAPSARTLQVSSSTQRVR